MSRTYTQERVVVSEAYPGKNWAKKVLEMSDEQVHEIYVSIMFRREVERKNAEKKAKYLAEKAKEEAENNMQK